MTEQLEPRQLLSGSSASSGGQQFASPFFAIRVAGDAQTLDLNNQSQTYTTLPDTTVNMTGRSELRITAASTPMTASVINLNSQDAWLFLTNIKPSIVNSTYLSQIRVNGAAAVNGTNVRVVQYELGTVVIPHSQSYQPLQTFTGPNFTGTAKSFGQYTIFNTSAELGEQFVNISSFKLKRGYMATLATKTDGTGSSKVYIAQDHDLDISILPTVFENAIQFIRVLPWRWVSKKGASDLSATTLNAQWFYNWNNDNSLASNLDAEYVPIRQQLYWPGLPTEDQKNVTHLSGFNEPNNPVEDAYTTLGNGSIDNAIAYYPAMQATGLRIGAPAVTDGGKAWLYEFMDKAIARGLRIDYIPIHMYQAGQTATSLYNWLKDIWDRYHKPVWITEFNNGANWTTAADPTYEQNAAAIGSFINMFDTTPWIERYSVYSRVEAVRQMTYDAGGLTPAGQVYYDNASPISYVQDAIPDSDTGSRAIAQLPLDVNSLDVSGHGNNGEVVGAISYGAGQRGQAALFDGSSTYVRLPENIANSSSFSFAAWVNWNGGGDYQRLFDFGNSTTQFMYLTPCAAGKMRFGIQNGAASANIETAGSLPVGSWQHVAVTLSGTTARIYVNGVQQATGTTVATPVSATMYNYLGESQFAADPLFGGRLDDVQISDVALTGSQIAALMTNTSPVFGSSAIARGPALRGLPFSSSISGTAGDADAGDSVTYGKASGPAWLSVAADGSLGGTPTFSDSGPQEFVVTATDTRGTTTFAILTVEIGETYWRGDLSNLWNANNAGNTNWASNAAGTNDIGALPNASSDIVFAASGAANLPGTILGAATSVRSIRIITPTGVTIGGSHNLTIGTSGLAVEAGSGATTINTSGQLILGANQVWIVDSTNGLTVSSIISGSASLTKDGTGVLVLIGNNLFSGVLTVAAGTLRLGNGTTTGGLSGNVINNGVFEINRTTNLTLAGILSGLGSLVKNATNTLFLTGVNSYSGTTTLNDGVIHASANNALGTGVLTIGPNGNATTARLNLSGDITLSNAISLPMRNSTTASVLNVSGTNTLANTITLNVGGANAMFQSDSGLLKLGAITSIATGSRSPTLTGSGNGLINGVISNGSGTVGLIKSGSGTWTLGAVNAYTGTTTVNAGTLAISGTQRIANASNLSLGGGSFATGGFSETLGTVTLSTNSGINFGAGSSSLIFSGIGTFTAGATLNITNWTQGADHLYIGTTAGLTAAQLAQIRFNGTAAVQLSSGEIVPVSSAAPTVNIAAAANPSPVTGTSATLSVLGVDDGGEANLTYGWTVTSKPAGAADPTFSNNGSNNAKSSIVTFGKAGTYTFLATIQDGSGLTVTSSVSVTVSPVFSGLAAASSTLASGTSVAVRGADQFGDAMSLGSATWSSNVGTVTQTGVFTAPVSGATSATITAIVGTSTYTTTVSITAGRGWYKADETGGSLIDSSGSGNHGSLSGAYNYIAGRSGSALNLSGGAADLPDGIVSGLTDFTFSAWVYLNSSPSWARIFDFGTGTNSNMFLTNNAGGTNLLRFAITTSGNGGEQRIDAPAMPIGVWTHVAVSLVGDVGTIYVNGVAVGTNNNLTLRPASLGETNNNYLGDSQYAADPALAARVDDIRILGTGFNAAGIVALRDAWQAPTVVNGGAVASPDVVLNQTTTTLSVLGASAAGEAGLTYTWSLLGNAPAPVSFSLNGTNAAKNTVATFAANGTYQFTVTITNALGASVTSIVSVQVTLPVVAANVIGATETYGVASHTLAFTFDRDVGDQPWNTLVEITSADELTTVTPSGISYDSQTHVLLVTLPVAAAIANGNYIAVLRMGTYLVADYAMPFFMLAGDADRNRVVDFSDLLILAQNYGGTSKTFEQGDFTGDGLVNFDDLLALAQNYGGSMPALAAFSNLQIRPVPTLAISRKRDKAVIL